MYLYPLHTHYGVRSCNLITHCKRLHFEVNSTNIWLCHVYLYNCIASASIIFYNILANVQTLIFSQFTSMLDILEDYLELRGLICSRLDGSMSFTEREQQMTMFRESPDCHVFLLSTRAGGLGINLTNADTVIIYDSDWVREHTYYVWFYPDFFFYKTARQGHTPTLH